MTKLFRHKKMMARILFLSLTIASVYLVPELKNLNTEYSITQFIPENHPLMHMQNQIAKDFSLDEWQPFMVTIETPGKTWLEKNKMDKLRELGGQLNRLDGVKEVLSLANIESASEDDEDLAVGSLLQLTSPETWKKRVTSDPVLFPLLLSEDLDTSVVLMYAELEGAKALGLIQSAEEVAAERFPGSRVRVGGVPALQAQMAELLTKELKFFLILALFAACLSLLLVFKNIFSIFVPMIGIVVSTLLTLELMVLLNFSLNALSATVTVLVTIIVVAMSTHTLIRFYKEYTKTKGSDKERKSQALGQTFQALFMPNLLTALTTAVGFLTLYFSPAVLIRQYGLSVSFSVLIAWLVTTTLIYGYSVYFPVPVPRAWIYGKSGILAKMLAYRKAVMVTVLTAAGILLVFGKNISWESRLFDDLPKRHEAREITEHIDQNLGGLLPVNFSFQAEDEAYWNNPEALKKIDKLSKSWRAMEGVGSVISVPDVIRQSKNNPDMGVPKSRKEIAEIYFMFSLAEKNLMEQYITPDGYGLRIGVRMQDQSGQKIQETTDTMTAMAEEAFPDLDIQAAGTATSTHVLNNYLSRTLMYGFWWALLAISVLLVFVFRSVRWTLVATIPNFLPAIAILGFLGITQIPLKPAIATVFSIALGIAFDNTVYILSRLRSYRQNVSPDLVEATIKEEGISCLISSICLFCGFAIFLMSYFSLSQYFGLFLLISIAMGLIGDLIFLPAVLANFPKLVRARVNTTSKGHQIVQFDKGE